MCKCTCCPIRIVVGIIDHFKKKKAEKAEKKEGINENVDIVSEK